MPREHTRLLQELRHAVAQLEQQLGRLETESEQAAQHRLIDELEHHIDAVDSRLASIKTFWTAIKHEREQRN